MVVKVNRRKVLNSAAVGTVAAALPTPFYARQAMAADPIVVGLQATTTSVAGVAVHLDHTQGRHSP